MKGVVWGLGTNEIDNQTVRHSGYLQIEDCRWGRICAPVELRKCVEPQSSRVITGVLPPRRLNKEVGTRQANKIFINVSSQLYETYTETLERFPNTLLGCSEARQAYYKTDTKQYCLGWRNLSSFDAILFYYQSNGILSRPVDVDAHTFYKEIRFFKLEERIVQRFLDREGLTISAPKDRKPRVLPGGRVWQLMEYPTSSRLAKALAVLSWLMICLSLVVFCGETLPSIRENATKKNAFNNLEITCVACFTLEYLVRLAFAPNSKKFVLSAMGCIDLLAYAPFLVTAIMTALEFNAISERLCCFVPVLKLLRVVRVLKFSRYVHGMNLLGKTVVQSSKELILLLLCLLIGSIFFASLAYLADLSEADTQIPSIPDGIWFILITLTNVGYGDIVPVSNLGKLNASVCVIVGIVVMSIPVPSSIFTRIHTMKGTTCFHSQ